MAESESVRRRSQGAGLRSQGAGIKALLIVSIEKFKPKWRQLRLFNKYRPQNSRRNLDFQDSMQTVAIYYIYVFPIFVLGCTLACWIASTKEGTCILEEFPICVFICKTSRCSHLDCKCVRTMYDRFENSTCSVRWDLDRMPVTTSELWFT